MLEAIGEVQVTDVVQGGAAEGDAHEETEPPT